MTDAPTLVDWEYAVRIGTRLAGEGPEVSRAEADEAVAELRADAHRSTGLVRDFTGLTAAPDRVAPVLVVDRGGWVEANSESFAHLLTPVMEKLTAKRQPGPVSRVIGSRITGAEIGLLLGFMGSKVLGQFDPFFGLDGAERGASDGASGVEGPAPHGRLMLVAPNVVHVERQLEVDPTDFRLWVCLHEETHRVQFTAVPWMRDHIHAQVGQLADTMEPGRMVEDALKRASEALRGRGGSQGASVMEMLSTPEQREVLDRVTGVMSLLEGHADVVMDGVGPGVIPSVREIRKRFTQRRQGVGALDRILRRLLGLDAKMAQYRDGAAFVHTVVDRVGMEGFNAVWAEPDNLPSKAEIHDPAAWVARIHG